MCRKINLPLSAKENALFDIQNGQVWAQMKGILNEGSLRRASRNSDLQWNMGLFSMQSGQYEKAVSRFRGDQFRLRKVRCENANGHKLFGFK